MRARNIKPSFFKNPDLGECSPQARLGFIGLWCMADREGRVLDRAKLVKAELFPYDDMDTEAILCELADCGLIKRYEAKGQKVIWIVNFAKHQSPHFKEKSSELPAFFESPVQAQEKPQAGTNLGQCQPPLNPESGLLNPECGILNPESGLLNPDTPAVAGESESKYQFVIDCWNASAAPAKIRKLTPDRQSKLALRLKDPQWPWREAISKLPISSTPTFTWQPDFDWLIANERNAYSLVEGKYDRKDATQPKTFAQIKQENTDAAFERVFGNVAATNTDSVVEGTVRGICGRTN